MNNLLERLYFDSPVGIQNVCISLYGYSLSRQRFGGKSLEHLKTLRQSQFYRKAEMQALQLHTLKALLKYATENVPFYQQYFRKHHISLKDFRSLADLADLPIIEKEDVRIRQFDFVSQQVARNKTFKLFTSGTSGKPLTIYCDADSRRRHYAFMQRLREWFGIRARMTRATFFGRTVVPANQTRPPFWRYDFSQRNYLFSSYHLFESNLASYYSKLKAIQPQEIIGYPSSLFILAKYMKKTGLSDIHPRVLFTTAETLLEHQRALIEEVFKQKVIDQYGCTEMAVFVSQCEEGTYHIHPEYGIVEVVDRNGNPVPAGNEGEIVCTSFINRMMPLIRYRLGDSITLSGETCSCGRQFPVVKCITGRTDDILFTPDGRPLGRLDPVFKGMSDIYETQIVQMRPDELTLKMVVGSNFSQEHKAALLYEIRKRAGSRMRVQIELLNSIPKEANGKFRSVVSRVRRP